MVVTAGAALVVVMGARVVEVTKVVEEVEGLTGAALLLLLGVPGLGEEEPGVKVLVCASLSDREKMEGKSSRTRTGDGSGDAAALNVDTRPEVVLGSIGITITGKLKNTDVPVSTVAAGAGGLGSDNPDKIIAAGRVPETHSVGRKVDLVGNVVPHAGVPVDAPLGLATDAPPQQGVRDARGARLPAGLEFGEVALEEGDLVLAGGGRGVGILAHQREVVEDLALVDGGRGLGDQLGTAHVLAVPVGRVVEGDFGTLVGAGVGRVLVAGGEIDIGGDLGRTVDVVLVRADLVAPRPLVEVGGGGEVVEAAIPENGTGRDGKSLGHEASKDRELHRNGGDEDGLVVVVVVEDKTQRTSRGYMMGS